MNERLPITWAPERCSFIDARSGLEVLQLTDHKGHSNHLYFTNPGWFDGGRRLMFGSDRHNKTDLFSVDLISGEILQHTGLEPEKTLNFLAATVNPIRDEVYFSHGNQVHALDLRSHDSRVIYDLPAGYVKSMLSCTADGRSVLAGLFKDMSDQFPVDLDRGYVGFFQTWNAHPHSMIVQIHADGSGSEIVWEENEWIGHVNASPTRPELLTFCHEGPWRNVDHRIWGFNLDTRDAWKIRPKTSKEHFGHEYWLADGEHVGYHGALEDGKIIFGFIKHDNTGQREVAFPFPTGHIHSRDMDLIVGDAGNVVRCWVWDESDQEYVGPHVLCTHDCTMKIQVLHVHPRFSPDGNWVVFTSDRSGYGNVYLVEVPARERIHDLPFELFS